MKFPDCYMVDGMAQNSFELFPKCDVMTFMVQQKLNLPMTAILLR